MSLKRCLKLLSDYKTKQIKDKDKEIKRLTKKIAECNGTKENVLLQYIEEIKTKLESPIIQDDDVIEIKEKKKSKKKDKKKKKKKNKKWK